jgi:hypothetical protein
LQTSQACASPGFVYRSKASPSGKVGYVQDDTISTLDSDRVCFLKDAAGWRITGYIDD